MRVKVRAVNRLDELVRNGRPILVCYMQLGDPAMPHDLVDIYKESGVDVIEVGFPCAAPHLDGPIVTKAMSRALKAGMTIGRMWCELKTLRQRCPDTAIVVMSYETLDLEDICNRPDEYGEIDGVLLIGADSARSPLFAESGPVASRLHRIGFVSHEMRPEELEGAARSGGYVMLQAAPGKTGLRKYFDPTNAEKVARLRASGIGQPILLGIGISNSDHVRKAMVSGADGVVMGSACIVHAERGSESLQRFIAEVRSTLDETR